jgi:hypothetical protein
MFRPINRVLQLIQRLTGLDVPALREQALPHNPGNLRPDFGHQISIGAPREFAGERHRLRRKGDDSDLWRRRRRWSRFLAAASSEQQKKWQDKKEALEVHHDENPSPSCKPSEAED